MSLETEMRNEVVRLEAEIQKINNEIKKLEIQMTQLLTLRKKKEHDLKILKYNFGEVSEKDIEFQTTLSRLLEENAR